MRITQVDPLPLIVQTDNGTSQQLVTVEIMAETVQGEAPRLVVSEGGERVEQTLTMPEGGGTVATLIRVPYTAEEREVVLTVIHGEKLLTQQKLTLEPVPEFVFYLFPSSHMCVAYENTMFLAHHDAAHAIAQAVHMLENYSEGAWSIEYVWGLQLYWDKHPEQHDLLRRLVREGRLEVGARLTPDIQDGLDGEGFARQIAEAQWWLEETFGVRAGAAFNWDNSVYYPQGPQLFRQGGLTGWVSGHYLDFDEDGSRPQTSRREGSPFFQHVGADGSATVVLAPTRGLQDHYCCSNVVGYYTFKIGGGLLRTLNPEAITVDYALELAGMIRRTQGGSGLDFLAGSADCGDQSGPKEELYQRVRTWNATFVTPQIRFLPAAECLKLAWASGKVTDRLEGDIPWWIRQVGNMFVLRFRANEVTANLRFAETLCALDSLTLGALDPREAMAAAWNELLHVQQHEQLFSGVCNGDDVLDWSNAALDRSNAIAHSCADLAMRDIASRISYAPRGKPVVVFNRLNWECKDIVSVVVPDDEENIAVVDNAGQAVPATIRQTTGGREVSFVAASPPLGYASYYLASGEGSEAQIQPTNIIENEFYRLTVDEKTGLITSLFDKVLERELVDPARPAGGFRLVCDDGGHGTDFWSISRPDGQVWWQGDFANSIVTGETTPLGQELVVRGPLLGEGEADFGEWREVRYRLVAGVPRVDISIRYMWGADKVKRAWLMFDLPMAFSKAQATYGSPYCAVDYREFDGDQPSLRLIRTMHNWCDLYDAGRRIGVTIAGPSTQVDLWPDGLAIALISRHGSTPGNLCIGLDGEHVFNYALRSHRGDWKDGEAVQFGCEHEAGSSPLRVVIASPRGGNLPTTQTLLPVEGEHLVVTALKQSHRGEDMILRLYETQGKPGIVSLPDAVSRGITEGWTSNILEEKIERLGPAMLNCIPVKPWEILSLRLKLALRGAEVANWKQ